MTSVTHSATTPLYAKATKSDVFANSRLFFYPFHLQWKTTKLICHTSHRCVIFGSVYIQKSFCLKGLLLKVDKKKKSWALLRATLVFLFKCAQNGNSLFLFSKCILLWTIHSCIGTLYCLIRMPLLDLPEKWENDIRQTSSNPAFFLNLMSSSRSVHSINIWWIKSSPWPKFHCASQYVSEFLLWL